MSHRLTGWLPIVCSSRRRRVSSIRLSVEDLADRIVPAAYTWTGASGTDLNFSTATNWKKDGVRATEPPGSNDDVTLGADAVDDVNKLRNPVMDRDFTIKSLNVPVIGGTQYILTLNGELDVFGDAPSTIASGTIGDGHGKIVFGPSDAAVFTWTGGTLDTDVDVSAGTLFHITGTDTKQLKRHLNDYSIASDWSDNGTVWLSTTDSLFDVKPGANFNINTTGDATMTIVLDAKFWNEGTVTANVAANKTLSFPAPGWVQNFGTWKVTQGTVSTRNYQNAGTTDIADSCTFQMGKGDLPGSTILESSPAVISKIIGDGYAEFTPGSTVTGNGAAVFVNNVRDTCNSVTGAADMIITGTYYWNSNQNGTTSQWTGAGQGNRT